VTKLLFLISILFSLGHAHAQTIRVGAKHFTEGYILSEIIAQLLEANGFKVDRKYNLGGTLVCFEALKNDEIDVYPEYSGTIAAEILRQPDLGFEEIKDELGETFDLELASPFGFSNSYALVALKKNANKYKIAKLSDLKEQKQLRVGLSYEFLKRQDGWDNLRTTYGLLQDPVALEHGLAYQALQDDKIDITDGYTTDGEILRYDLIVLNDDLQFFPSYLAASLYRQDLSDSAKAVLSYVGNKINDRAMRAMNAKVLFEKRSFEEVARDFLLENKFTDSERVSPPSAAKEIWTRTLTHITLTFVALALAALVALPLAVALYWHPRWANATVYITGLLQTIPSIALLAIMIPLFGIGVVPAVVALFLYALLPILRNALSGLQTVDHLLKRVADGIGMTRFQKLWYVELPLAMPMIMAGIRTAAVINVGTATLAAFIGAGGLGEFIVSGLALNDTGLILRGAIPAALLALAVELAFTFLERMLVPRHLRAGR
jgi:osmoprotectant transport system permease protein